MIAKLLTESNADYHRKKLGVASASGLKVFGRSPAHYLELFLTEQEPPTPAMRFGLMVHTRILEPDVFAKNYVVAPGFGDLRTKAAKAARDEFMAANAGRELLDADDCAAAFRMAVKVADHETASVLIAEGVKERSIYWTDPETSLECKARLDIWYEAANVIGDLKTTDDASPEAFRKAIANLEYHVQAAWYRRAIRELTGNVPTFVFIAVEKSPPFSVATYQLDDAALERGEQLVQERLYRLADCLAKDEWPGYGGETMTLSLPTWATR